MASNSEIKFGTDGWRGIMAWDFTFENVQMLAQAVADYARSEECPKIPPEKNAIAVGYDRRFLSDQFAADIARILRANKFDVILMDKPVTTPQISLLTAKKAWLGIMVTASHNPFQYNGIKIKLDGRSAPQSLTSLIEAQIGKNEPLLIHSMRLETENTQKDYLHYVKSAVNTKAIAAGLKKTVVVDCMHGSAAGLMPALLATPKIKEIRTKHDPLFGGVQPEPIKANLAALTQAVTQEKALAGIAFDGDGDRIAVIDENGEYLTPCQLFAVLLKHLIAQRKLKGKVVQCVSLGYLTKRIAKASGLPFEEVPVGFKHLAEKILKEDVLVGAEESGGFAWKGTLPERDSILTALLFLEAAVKSGKTPSQLIADIEKTYGKSVYLRRDYRLHKTIPDVRVFAEKLKKKLPKKLAGQVIATADTQDGLKVILESDEWLLMRPSGTEPLMRIYAESDSAAKTKQLLDAGEKLVSGYSKTVTLTRLG